MKIIIVVSTIAAGFVSGLYTQPESPADTPIRSAAFKVWAGQWEGTGSMQTGPGAPKRAAVKETIEYRLDSTVLIIEGIGKSLEDGVDPNTIVHHAMAVLSYDPSTDSYKMRSYLADGRSTDAWFKQLADGEFQWGFEAPNVRMRYTIRVDSEKQTWHEVGEYSRDGSQWYPVFEMNLNKVQKG